MIKDDDEEKTFLQYDAQGFIVSLMQSGRDVSKIDKNVESIRDILLTLQKEFTDRYANDQTSQRPQLSAFEQALIDAARVPVDFGDLINVQAQTTTALNQSVVSIDDLINQGHGQVTQSIHNDVIDVSSIEDVIALGENNRRDNDSSPDQDNNQDVLASNSVDPQRDADGNENPNSTNISSQSQRRGADGRFIGADSESPSKLSKVAKFIGTVIKGVMPQTSQGVDPTVDAINEVATVLSPVKRVAGFMLKPLTGLMKSRKRNEPIPREQEQHNRRLIRILQRIADNSGSGGLLSGLMKFLPLLLAGVAGILGIGKGKEALDNLADESRPAEQGDINPDGSSNKGVIGLMNRKAKGFMNGVRGTANSAIGAVTGNYEVLDDGTGEYSKNRIGLKTDAINQNGQYLYRPQPTPFGAVGNKKQAPIKDGIKGDKQKAFIEKNWGMAVKIADALDTKPELILSQFAAETDWGQKVIKGTNNLGNIKANKSWRGNTVKAYDSIEKSHDPYKVYETPEDFADDYIKLIGDSKRYKSVVGAKTAEEFYTNLKKSGYATDKDYVKKGVDVAKSVTIRLDMDKVNNKGDYQKETSKKSANFIPNIEAPNAKTVIENQAETMMQKVKPQASMLSTKPAITPVAARTNSLAASYTPPKLETKIEPLKEYLTSPDPQKVHVVNSNGGNINQNVSDRILAHAITGGLGQGKWNG